MYYLAARQSKSCNDWDILPKDGVWFAIHGDILKVRFFITIINPTPNAEAPIIPNCLSSSLVSVIPDINRTGHRGNPSFSLKNIDFCSVASIGIARALLDNIERISEPLDNYRITGVKPWYFRGKVRTIFRI
jgi:hypothetical protein